MQSWEEGKRQLEREFARICSQIDENLSAEITNSTTVQVEKEELQLLRENSAQIQKLAEHNARLVDELEKCRAVAMRVDSIEKENKNLASELKNVLSKLKVTNEPEHSLITTPPASTGLAVLNDNKIDIAEHQRLIKKYNVQSKNCNQLKEAWVKMEGKLREQKKKGLEWELHLQQKNASIKKKKEKIWNLEQEVKELKNRISKDDQAKYSSDSEPKTNSTLNSSKDKEEVEEVLILARNKTSLDPSSRLQSCFSVIRDQNCLQASRFSPSIHPIHPKFPLEYEKNHFTSFGARKTENYPGDHFEEEIQANLDPTSVLDLEVTERLVMEEVSEEEPNTPNESNMISTTCRAIKPRKMFQSEQFQYTKSEKIKTRQTIRPSLESLGKSMDLDDIGLEISTPKKRRSSIEPSQRTQNFPHHNIESKSIYNTPSDVNFTKTFEQSHTSSQISFLQSSTAKTRDNDRRVSNFNKRLFLKSPEDEQAQGCEKPVAENSEYNGSSKQRFDALLLPKSTDNSPGKCRSTSEIVKNDDVSGLKLSQDRDILSLSDSFERSYEKFEETAFLSPVNSTFDPKLDCKTRKNLDRSANISFPTPSPYSREPLISPTAHLKIRLRSRPIEDLDCQDFKINPEYNRGYEYAFSEVVRGHSRSRLQGCLRPCCEPKYRALAEISRNPTKLLTISQNEADQLILEEFMGDNAHKLKNMSVEEREEVLIQAKTRDLANKHGIHRHAYENMETPVGIWRADFPTTQEVIEDEKKFLKRKRKIVEKRYAEAMRPGGAYKFRDE